MRSPSKKNAKMQTKIGASEQVIPTVLIGKALTVMKEMRTQRPP